MTDSSEHHLPDPQDPTTIFDLLDSEARKVAEAEARMREEADATGTPRPQPGELCVGVVCATGQISDMSHPYWGPVLAALRSRLTAAGCDILLSHITPASQLGDAALAACALRAARRGLDGLLVLGFNAMDPDVLETVEQSLPAVFIDHDPIGRRLGCVMSDSVSGMDAAVTHLARLGRRRIAHLTGNLHARTSLDRLLGYRSALSRAGLEAPEEYVKGGNFYHGSGLLLTRELLALPEPPDAIAAASDMMAIGAMVAIEQAGLRVPEDVAVTGFDDAEFATLVRPALTTVRQDMDGLGRAAAEAILHAIARPDDPPAVTIFPTELVVRESCGIELTGPPRAAGRADAIA